MRSAAPLARVTVPEPDQCPDNPTNGFSEPGSEWACVARQKIPQAATNPLRGLAEFIEKNEAITFDPTSDKNQQLWFNVI
jgi:hypothetical protein